MAALYFDPEGYTMTGPRLMGRNAAGHSFLRGFLRHSSTERIGALVSQQAHGTALAEFANAECSAKQIATIPAHELDALRPFGTLYLPGPGLDQFAYKRALGDARAFSLSGITHTTLSARAMDAIASLLTAPIEDWDALICTSHSVLDTVTRVLDAKADYLTRRLGATRFTRPQLPVIPLGLNTDEFALRADLRASVRHRLGIGEDEIVVLFVGRLSFHAKAHPAAMYQALERESADRSVTLIECGWFANDAIAQAFAEAAAELAPHVRRIVLDGRDAGERQTAWHAADIFMSLTDNLQETFGITPIEAMAAGLPVIVSDWDGYRDTVRDGIDGFRIPTLMPDAQITVDPAQAYALERINYDYYCGMTNHLVAVDLDATCKALHSLMADAGLRRKMGEAGQKRARSVFDWAHIIPQYEALWEELAHRRVSATSEKTRHPWPARMNPFEAFASYPTELFDSKSRFRRRDADSADHLIALRHLKSFTISNLMLMKEADLRRVLDHIPMTGSTTLDTITAQTGQPVTELAPLILFGLKTGCLIRSREA